KENYYLNARDLAVDGLGNVYVTGFGDDYLTVKYDSSGGEQWTATYNGPGNSYDYAEALAVDPAGNVYVTGQSDFGCVTVKYNTAGVEQWVARQTEAQTEQGGRKVLIDANGNVVVAGISHPSGQLNLLDYLTIQYNPAGQENWHHFYSRQDSSYDLVNALAVAPDGAVYLTGMSFGDEDFYNFVTVKYDLAGNEEWAAGYDGPKRSYAGISATATDLQGNVYVTGGCSNENGGWAWPDYATIKYDPDGQELWRAIYNGPANSTDWAKDITVDAAGNVYITGFATLEGGRSTDYLTIKYDAAGQEQWVAAYNGPASSQDYAYALGLDGNGNVYVSGYSRDPTGTNATITTVQYDPSGNEQWVARYLGAFDLFEQKVSLVVDQSGNCYVAGMHFEMTYTDRDFALVKYSSTGVERWAVRYAGPGNGEDSVTDLATDNSGNIYLTGRSVGNGSGSDYATVKYDSTGQELWLARYDGPAGQEDAAAAIELDSSGNIYVTGFSGGFGGADFATVKYDPDGNLLWVERLDGQSGGADMATALTVSAAGRICITGNSEGADGLMDVLTVQYDSEGMVRGLRVFDNPALPDNRVAAIVTGPGEQVYVAGYSGSEKPRSYSPVIGIGNLDSKFALIKYSAGPVAIDVAPTGLPGTFGLSQNYPNPFNHTSVINYHIERAAFVTLAVYNILGQKVATLFEGHRAPGNYRAIFDGRGLASGLYFYSLNSGSSSQTLKLQLVK
ncbi:MAG TPA: SBBP repeat-containing protein, partial [Calditrichia bacterium]|nr:SBBP repeat-containing protein [Calditrichia bacterium]